ncbi:MAG: flippase-like domain-containing protein, partial [Betaproteobacteria bacterium]|nr:flippase-like domain-containing protein [Betaproteobacteria bacterium]
LLVPLAVAVEQVARAWKWRQILFPMRQVGISPLFGAIMAGYLAGLLIPFGFSALARAWLVARREALTTAGVLATVAIDRFTDGVVFALLVPVALLLVVFPDPGGEIRATLTWSAAGSLVLFAALLLALAAYKRAALRPGGQLMRLLDRFPERAARALRGIAESFAEGIVWPREFWRGLGIVSAAVAIKLIAATHLLWAGLALGVALRPGHYLFLIVFLGFVVILGHFARIPGSFIIGAVFALGLFGVAEEPALAMALIVQAASLLTVAALGALALWRQGVALADLRAAGAQRATSG